MKNIFINNGCCKTKFTAGTGPRARNAFNPDWIDYFIGAIINNFFLFRLIISGNWSANFKVDVCIKQINRSIQLNKNFLMVL
jgi:hypothetical protein